jgi:Bacterial archaeo-eukaryotic release factor family 2
VKLGFLRPLFERSGNYVSVYLDTDRAHENAVEQIELRLRAARDRLAQAGAGPAVLNAVAAAVGDQREAAPGLAVFANDDAVLLTAALEAPPRRQIARLAPLPHLMPLLAQRRPPVPHVRVSATRSGGEIVAAAGSEEGWREWVAGRAWPVHKTSVGGWSQDRYQRSVEKAWEENAKALAADVAAVAGRTGARHVIIAGDVHARSLLLPHLPTPLRESAVVLEEEVDAGSPTMAEAANRALSDWAERHTRQQFDDWQARLGHGLAVQGLTHSMTAFREGQVSDLFLFDDPSSIAEAWIGPAGNSLAASREELVDWGVPGPTLDRADAAIVRAIVGTDAELHFLPADLVGSGDLSASGGYARPQDGVCATLRFSLGAG